MYENDAIVRNARPPGANSIETQLMICVYTRDYMFERISQPDLPYVSYIIARFTKMLTGPDGKVNVTSIEDFEKMIALEVVNCQTVLLVTISGELTSRGLTFIQLALNGSYNYIPQKFENLLNIYVMILTMEVSAITNDDCMCEECQAPPEVTKEEDEVINVSIPVSEFVHLVDKYKKDKSIISKFKGLFSGGK